VYNIKIRRPMIEDKEELTGLFSTVIRDTFVREGLEEMHDDIENEIETKKAYLKDDLDSNGKNRYFLIALIDDNVVGTIEYGPSSDLINRCTNGALKELVEVGTVFVRPDYQRHGIGNLLLNAMYLTLLSGGIEEFCLDSGYTNAQKIWEKKLGKPDYLLKNYWGEGYNHKIWKRRIADISIMFRGTLPKLDSNII
jgi:GNAT superfamily N-acetyltransferase